MSKADGRAKIKKGDNRMKVGDLVMVKAEGDPAFSENWGKIATVLGFIPKGTRMVIKIRNGTYFEVEATARLAHLDKDMLQFVDQDSNSAGYCPYLRLDRLRIIGGDKSKESQTSKADEPPKILVYEGNHES